jgi:hypothetical protein
MNEFINKSKEKNINVGLFDWSGPFDDGESGPTGGNMWWAPRGSVRFGFGFGFGFGCGFGFG